MYHAAETESRNREYLGAAPSWPQARGLRLPLTLTLSRGERELVGGHSMGFGAEAPSWPQARGFGGVPQNYLPTLIHEQATVHVDGLAGDVAGRVAEQEGNGCG